MQYIIEIYAGKPGNTHYAGYVFAGSPNLDEVGKEAKQIEARPNVAYVNIVPYRPDGLYD